MGGICRAGEGGLELVSTSAGTFAGGMFCDEIHTGHMQLRGLLGDFRSDTMPDLEQHFLEHARSVSRIMGAMRLVYNFKPRHLSRFGRMSQYGSFGGIKKGRSTSSDGMVTASVPAC